MAMNKKEQAEMERLKTILALRHYPAIGPDVLPPEIGSTFPSEIKNGFLFNAHCAIIVKACTSCVGHGRGQWDKTDSQGSRSLYSTEKLAYQAMLHEMAMGFAGKLREVERKMEELNTGENNQ